MDPFVQLHQSRSAGEPLPVDTAMRLAEAGHWPVELDETLQMMNEEDE